MGTNLFTRTNEITDDKNGNQCRALYSLIDSAFNGSQKSFFEEVLGKEFIEKYITYFLEQLKKIQTESEDLFEIDEKVSKLILPFIRELLLRLGFTDGLLFDLLESWYKSEKVIFVTKSPYREHFIHQFHDFLVGCLFINKLYNGYELDNFAEYKTTILDQHLAQLNEKEQKIGLTTEEKNSIERSKKEIEIKKANLKKCSYSKKQFLRRWLFTAMFHDVGYPAETLNDLKKHLNKEYYNKIPNYEIKELKYETFSPDDNFSKLLFNIACVHLFSEEVEIGQLSDLISLKSNYLYSVNELINLMLDEINQTHDHGVTGAVFFLKTALIDVREIVYDPDDIKVLSGINDVKEDFDNIIDDLFVAASAIAGHNMRVHTYKNYTIDFSARPIASLLEFCDDIQEWSRRKSSPSPKYYNPLSDKIELYSIDDVDNNLTIQFTYKDSVDIPKPEKFKEIKKLFDINLSDFFGFFYKKIEINTFYPITNSKTEFLKVDLFVHTNPLFKHKQGRYKTKIEGLLPDEEDAIIWFDVN